MFKLRLLASGGDVESAVSSPDVQKGASDKGMITSTDAELEAFYATAEDAPIFFGGSEGGETSQSAYLEGAR